MIIHILKIELYQLLVDRGIEVLWDDRLNIRVGEKCTDADVIGVPVRLVISKKSLENGGIEMKLRSEEKSQIVQMQKVANEIFQFLNT